MPPNNQPFFINSICLSLYLSFSVIGDDSPSVHLDRAQYHPGDPVTVECQSPYSFPPANITWFYNETEVRAEPQHCFYPHAYNVLIIYRHPP